MTDLNNTVNSLRKEYREIFLKSAEEIKNKVEEIRPEGVNGEIFDKFETQSSEQQWQKAVLELLEKDISKEVYRKLNEILAYRIKFNCVGCATCCNLACSEFSPEELREKAQNGDNFATQFLSVFIPYASKEEARKIYPEYIELLEKNKEYDVYFYHCPKLTADKRCSDYGNRPQICRDFPDNPLSLLPKVCGYKKWKEEVEPIVLMLHAMVEIIDFYTTRIKEAL